MPIPPANGLRSIGLSAQSPSASREGSLTSWWQLTDGLTLQERLVLGQGGVSGGVGGIKEEPGTSDMSQRRRA